MAPEYHIDAAAATAATTCVTKRHIPTFSPPPAARRIHRKVRIGEWEFALYTPAGQPINADFEKACMPCHKQVEATDYNFLVTNYFADMPRR